jgi:hypothetical protein
LAITKPDSIDGPDADSIVGNSINETWQRGAAGANQFSEFFLDGNSAFTASRTESLGKIFNPSTPEAGRDVQFFYTTIFGDVIEGIVEYTASTATADFDSDGDVDGNDFLKWQRGVGAGSSLSQGDANGDGVVNGTDLAVWRQQFHAASAPATTAVPELGVLGMLAAIWLAAGIAFRRRGVGAAWVATASIVAMCDAPSANAQVIPPPTVDRAY